MGRPDFWNLKKEHTPFQWSLQQAIYQVAPYGEKRADRRLAVCTANLMRMHSTQDVSKEQFLESIEALEKYLLTAEDFEESEDLDILKRMKGKT